METQEQTKIEQNWIADELAQFGENKSNIPQVEGLKVDENELYELEVDVSKPWEKWIDNTNDVVKKIIPVTWKGNKYNFWLNTRNPLYRTLLEKCQAGVTKVKITRTGKNKDTRYNLLE